MRRKNLKKFFFRAMEHVDDDLRELTGLSLEQLFAEANDDMYTHFSGDASMQDIIDFNIDVTDLLENEPDVQLANVDWDKVDWAHVAANWHDSDINWHEDDPNMALTIKSLLKDDQAQKNKRRRRNEAERLQKYSWERLPTNTGGKRVRYRYVHADGSTVTSLRAALEKCRK